MYQNALNFILSLFLIFNFSNVSSQSVITLIDSFPASGGVKLGPDGHVYIGNYGDALPNANGTQVWRYHINQDSLELFSNGLFGASGNTFAPDGFFYQSNIASGSISKINSNGAILNFASGLSSPVGLVSDSAGNLFVCECGSNEISKIDTNGAVTLFSTSNNLSCPNGITMDHDGNLYVSNFNDDIIVKITSDGVGAPHSFIPGFNNGHLTYHKGDSCLYVASHGSSQIYRVTLGGVVNSIAGSGIRGNLDGSLSQASFSRPNGIAVSQTGDTIFVNSSIPTTNGPGFPLNPMKLRAIIGLNSVVGKQEWNAENKWKVYPNPSSGPLEIIGIKEGAYSFGIYALNGQKVLDRQVEVQNNDILRLDFSALDIEAGVYFLSLHNREYTYSRKIQFE